MHNPLINLERYGQSIWLDYISRSLIESGDLERLIKNDHLKGVTSNPSIFDKAIAKTNDYDDAIGQYCKQNIPPERLYEQLAIKDIQDACDLLRPVYEQSSGRDGFACLEVSPHLAYDAQGSIEEGHRLWQMVQRPNLMVKIPGTKDGIVAIQRLIAEGVNVNVTLLFSQAMYQQAALAYIDGLEERIKLGLPIKDIQSVASFFISRIDAKIDALLEQMAHHRDEEKAHQSKSLLGKAAIANAKIAYVEFAKLYQTPRAQRLLEKGAAPQRLLWASTSAKNPRFRDVLYVESLIGAQTVNTLPFETLTAFRDHGEARASLTSDTEAAHKVLAKLAELGIDFDAICNDLQKDGVNLFINAFDQLIQAVSQKSAAAKQGIV